MALNREDRARIAQETLDIVNQGFYYNRKGEKIDVSMDIESAKKYAKLYCAEKLETIGRKAKEKLYEKSSNIEHHDSFEASGQDFYLEVTNETTLSAAKRLYDQGYDVVCLNFASARNPGGGFLKGSDAQEESLARASALYSTLKTQPEYYRINKACESALYTDNMIYSPGVPVFRDDNGALQDRPYKISFITAPAVNAGVVEKKEPENIPFIGEIMEKRIQLILALAAYRGHNAVVLGAFGCGVFKNNPENVAGYFADCFYDKAGNPSGFSFLFSHVTFAVLDRSKTKNTYRIFSQKLSRG